MPIHQVAVAADLPPGSARRVEVEGRPLALFNVDGTFYAIDDVCTHAEAPLSEGTVQGTCVVCPWHGAEFDLCTGKALTPPAAEDVRCYKVTVSDGNLLVEIGE